MSCHLQGPLGFQEETEKAHLYVAPLPAIAYVCQAKMNKMNKNPDSCVLLTASWWIMNNNWQSKAASTEEEAIGWSFDPFSVLWYPLSPGGMAGIVYAKLCSEVIKKKEKKEKKTAQMNQSTVKLINTLERRNWGNAIFYRVIRICANLHSTLSAHFLLLI